MGGGGGGNGIRASKQFMFSIGKVMLILYMGLSCILTSQKSSGGNQS